MLGKICGVGLPGDLGAGLAGLADDLQLGDGAAALVALVMDLAVTIDLDLEPLGERVHDGDADAVEAAGDLVGAAAELGAGVQHGHGDFHARLLHLGVNVDRDAHPVVGDGEGAVLVEDAVDLGAATGEGLVDRVIHDLDEEVMEAAGGGAADVHGRALAHRLQALEDLNILRLVLLLRGLIVLGQDELLAAILPTRARPLQCGSFRLLRGTRQRECNHNIAPL